VALGLFSATPSLAGAFAVFFLRAFSAYMAASARAINSGVVSPGRQDAIPADA